MEIRKYFEFVKSDFDAIKSFYIKDELSQKVWDDFKLKDEIKEQLITIGQDFFEKTEIEVDVKDIVFCGSLCNYNWSEKYSDFDLHIIIDFNDVNEDYELVEKLCDYAKKIWNEQHDIHIKGYEVEVCIQDNSLMRDELKTSKMGGVYSLTYDKWVKRPTKVDFKPNAKEST
jgi:predicted nucleotidyltransferase